jgi:hypothetical protein
MENTQRKYEVYSTLLPTYKVTMPVKATCKYCNRILYTIWILILYVYFFNYISEL